MVAKQDVGRLEQLLPARLSEVTPWHELNVASSPDAVTRKSSARRRATTTPGARSIRTAKQAVIKAGQYAYRDRRAKKRDFRALWITRINAARACYGLSYSRLMHGLKAAGLEIDRKMLADLAVHDPTAFGAIAEQAKASLAAATPPTRRSPCGRAHSRAISTREAGARSDPAFLFATVTRMSETLPDLDRPLRRTCASIAAASRDLEAFGSTCSARRAPHRATEVARRAARRRAHAAGARINAVQRCASVALDERREAELERARARARARGRAASTSRCRAAASSRAACTR